MDSRSVYQQLKGHEWIVKANGASHVRMGSNGGILALEFLSNGQIGSESNMAFWPNVKKWQFDERSQQIQFVDINDEVVQSFSLPKRNGNQVYLQEIGGRDQYTYSLITDSTRNLLEVPMPSQIELGNGIPVQKSDVVVQLNGTTESPLAVSIQRTGMNFEQLCVDLTTAAGWQELAKFIVDHPGYEHLLVAKANYQLLKYPFENVLNQRIYLDDYLDLINVAEEKQVQKLSAGLLLGDRTTLLEIIYAIYLGAEGEAITEQYFNQIVYKYFADRIVHGRLVTAKTGITSSDSWLTEVSND